MGTKWAIFNTIIITVAFGYHMETGDKFSAWYLFFMACSLVALSWAQKARRDIAIEYKTLSERMEADEG